MSGRQPINHSSASYTCTAAALYCSNNALLCTVRPPNVADGDQCTCLLHNSSRNFETNDSIPIILDANNGLSHLSDTTVASVAPPESQKKKFELPKKKRDSFVSLANEVPHFSELLVLSQQPQQLRTISSQFGYFICSIGRCCLVPLRCLSCSSVVSLRPVQVHVVNRLPVASL